MQCKRKITLPVRNVSQEVPNNIWMNLLNRLHAVISESQCHLKTIDIQIKLLLMSIRIIQSGVINCSGHDTYRRFKMKHKFCNHHVVRANYGILPSAGASVPVTRILH